MKLKWSIADTKKGARTIEEITEKSKLSKNVNNGITVVESQPFFYSFTSSNY